jgi:hypothetical protein
MAVGGARGEGGHAHPHECARQYRLLTAVRVHPPLRLHVVVTSSLPPSRRIEWRHLVYTCARPIRRMRAVRSRARRRDSTRRSHRAYRPDARRVYRPDASPRPRYDAAHSSHSRTNEPREPTKASRESAQFQVATIESTRTLEHPNHHVAIFMGRCNIRLCESC